MMVEYPGEKDRESPSLLEQRLRAEVARLQTELEKARAGRAALRVEFEAMTEQAEKAIEMGKGERALAKLRGEALKLAVPLVESMIATGHVMSRGVRTEPTLDAIRAAIDALPAEAREKGEKAT